MITQYSTCFLILLLCWSKCLNLSPATLEIFLNNLKKSKFKKTAFSEARTGLESFLIFRLSPFPSPLCLWPSLCVCSHQEPYSPPTSTMCCTALRSPCWRNLRAEKGRKTRFQPSAFLSACLECCLASPVWREFTQALLKGNECLHNKAGCIDISNI